MALKRIAAAAAVLLFTSSFAAAQQAPPLPAPDHPDQSATPAPQSATPAPETATPASESAVPGPAAIPGPGVPTDRPIELYPHVKVEDRDNIHPHAVPMIVAVADPCRKCRLRAPCHECRLRFILICVPPDCRPEIDTRLHGRKIEYDFGEYEVEIYPRDDYVKVNYDD